MHVARTAHHARGHRSHAAFALARAHAVLRLPDDAPVCFLSFLLTLPRHTLDGAEANCMIPEDTCIRIHCGSVRRAPRQWRSRSRSVPVATTTTTYRRTIDSWRRRSPPTTTATAQMRMHTSSTHGASRSARPEYSGSPTTERARPRPTTDPVHLSRPS